MKIIQQNVFQSWEVTTKRHSKLKADTTKALYTKCCACHAERSSKQWRGDGATPCRRKAQMLRLICKTDEAHMKLTHDAGILAFLLVYFVEWHFMFILLLVRRDPKRQCDAGKVDRNEPPQKVLTSKTKFKTHEMSQKKAWDIPTLQSTVPRIFPGRMHPLQNCQSLRQLFKTFCTFCTLHSPTFEFRNNSTAQYEIVTVADWPPDEALKKVAAAFSDWQAVQKWKPESLNPFDQFDPGRFL